MINTAAVFSVNADFIASLSNEKSDFVGTPTIVSQVSMRPTLQSGQRLILNRWMRTINEMPKRGVVNVYAISYILLNIYNIAIPIPAANILPKSIFPRNSTRAPANELR